MVMQSLDDIAGRHPIKKMPLKQGTEMSSSSAYSALSSIKKMPLKQGTEILGEFPFEVFKEIKKMPLKQGTEILLKVELLSKKNIIIKKMPLKQGTEIISPSRGMFYEVFKNKKDAPKAGDGNCG